MNDSTEPQKLQGLDAAVALIDLIKHPDEYETKILELRQAKQAADEKWDQLAVLKDDLDRREKDVASREGELNAMHTRALEKEEAAQTRVLEAGQAEERLRNQERETKAKITELRETEKRIREAKEKMQKAVA